MVIVFLTEGFEEIEAVAPIDLLRRAGVEVRTVSVSDEKTVCGGHGISLNADMTMSEYAKSGIEAEMLVLPGGGGVFKLAEHAGLCKIFRKSGESTKIAGICAAPFVLGKYGVTSGKKVTAFPSVVEKLDGEFVGGAVVTDGRLTTARSAGSAIDFGLELVRILKGAEACKELAESIVYERTGSTS